MHEVKLKPATISDLPRISELAAIIWNHHYPAIITQEQIDYMLRLMYSADSLLEQVNKKNHRFYLIAKNDADVGFISVRDEGQGKWFINKFYVHQNEAAKGIGSEALAALIKLLDPKVLSLTVNRKNFKAINFYFKCGFKIREVADFDIGNGYVMNDFVMEWKL